MQGQEAVGLGSGGSPLTQGLPFVPSTSPHTVPAVPSLASCSV